MRRLKKRARDDVQAPDDTQGGLEDEGFEAGPSTGPIDMVHIHATFMLVCCSNSRRNRVLHTAWGDMQCPAATLQQDCPTLEPYRAM